MRKSFFQKIKIRERLLFSILLLLISIFLNFYRLGDLPKEPYSFDMIHDVNRANSILKGKFAVFFPENNFPAGGVEAGFYYLIALVSLITKVPVSFFLFKIVSASLAVVSTILLFIFLKEEFNIFTAALVSLYFSCSSWLFLIVRIAYRGIALIPLTIYIIWFFSNFLKRETKDFVFLGAVLSLGVYLNTVFIFMLPLTFVLIGIFTVFFFNKIKKKFVNFSFTLIFLLVLCFPIIRYAFLKPNVFFGRVIYRNNERKVMELIGEKYWRRVAGNYFKTIFFTAKDGIGQSFPHFVNSYPGATLFSKTTFCLFIVGFLSTLISFFKKRKIYLISSILLILFVSPLPSVLYSTGFEGEIPDVFRLVLGIIPSYVLIAFAIDYLKMIYTFIVQDRKNFLGVKLFCISLVILVTISIFKENWRRNFVYYPRQYAWQNFPLYETAVKEIGNFQGDVIIRIGYPFDPEVFSFFLGDRKLINVRLVQKIDWDFLQRGENVIVISDSTENIYLSNLLEDKCRIKNHYWGADNNFLYSTFFCGSYFGEEEINRSL